MAAENAPAAFVFCSGDRVLIVGKHPWASYAGKLLGDWPTRDMDYLVQLDNGMNIGVMAHQVRHA